MPTRPCPGCGQESDSRFCPSCGTALSGAPCPACGADVGTASFCPRCGAAVRPARRTAGAKQRAGWIVAGVAAVALVVAMGYQNRPAPTPAPPAPPPASGALGAAPGIDLSTMTAREAADRLFNRVIRAVEANDATEVRNFVPMAIAAYALVDSLGPDGAYHLASLHRVSGNYDAALAAARQGLAEDENHLLCLSEVAASALASGDTALAREFAGRFLRLYDGEMARGLADYDLHGDILPDLRARAEAIANGG